jgi:hypothetical protein
VRKVQTLAVLLAFIAVACGGTADSSDGESTATTTIGETETTSAPSTTATTIAATTTTVAETTTTAAETTTAVPAIATSPVVPGADPDVDAIVEVYRVVFDSTTSYEEKAPFITDPTGLEDTVTRYQEAGDGVGGIALSTDEVGIEGDTAVVIYSFLFAGNPAYSDLQGEAVRTEDGWQITREFFCDIMASARVGCP